MQASYNLGFVHEYGLGGVAVHLARAERYYRRILLQADGLEVSYAARLWQLSSRNNFCAHLQIKVTVHLTLARIQLRAWLLRHGISEPWLVACGLLIAGEASVQLPDTPKLTWPWALVPVVQSMEAFLEEVIGRPQILYVSTSQRGGSWGELLWLEWEVAAAAALSAVLLALLAFRCCCNRST
jgi:hypothetical protein